MYQPDGFTGAAAPAGSPYKELGAIGTGTTTTVTIEFTRTGTPPITYTGEDHRPTTRCAIYEVKAGKMVRLGEFEVPRKKEWLGL